ncbi:hypothetical protein [Enterobacter hormaechei]|uniref:hypothetical protein n=1 Tax=Enterobacter hormaechei TaxID=158836 RepID=UPI00177DE927|nr:hypothetical protein [Enterobacter hormaechei]MBD8851359.1 hypothetical protein [Enterobacter hormaechei]MDH1745111.1 hypothetical protein [Enterobacter hormaechei]WNN61122.1 hypothetical protein RIN68_20515 [Enterobacter hormaechei]
MSDVETDKLSKGTEDSAPQKNDTDSNSAQIKSKNMDDRVDGIKTEKIIFYILSVVAMGLILFPIGSVVFPFFSNIWPTFIGVALLVGIYTYSSHGRYYTRKAENSFVDVDYKYSSVHSVEKYIDEQISLRFSEVNQHNSDDADVDSVKGKAVDYAGHSLRVLSHLQAKADAADEKASILLQRGIAYTKFGIAYYLASIILWQIIFFYNGYKKEYLWGIASCSFLFLFIEFLSAWFLKQYKNFTDNSVYLLKVKAIFDRYLLLYHLENDNNAGGNGKNKATINSLSKDIIWPDVSVIESKEDTFGKEAMASLTEAIKALKTENK